MSRPRLRSRLLADVRAGMAVAGAGLLVAALVEAVVTWKTFRGDLGAILTLRLVALALTLFGLTWLALGPLGGEERRSDLCGRALGHARCRTPARCEPPPHRQDPGRSARGIRK